MVEEERGVLLFVGGYGPTCPWGVPGTAPPATPQRMGMGWDIVLNGWGVPKGGALGLGWGHRALLAVNEAAG